MSLRYEWAFDLSVIGALAVVVDDDGSAGEARLDSGTYAHTSIATVVDIEGNAVARYADYTSLAAALKTELDATSGGSGSYTVTWNGTTGYTIAYSAGNFSLSFSTVTTPAEGLLLRQILGFAGDLSGAATYSSTVRPFFVVIPAIQARSGVSDEYEAEAVVVEEVADDGTPFHIARETAEIWSDWTQAAETETAPSTFSGEGTFLFRRQATAAAPWAYQDAWKHMREGDHPFLVIDTGSAESAVHSIRADGGSFCPLRFGGEDLPYWSVPFRTRLIGRLP